MADKNTINVKDYRKNIVEYKADSAISPGQLVKVTATGVAPYAAATDLGHFGVAVALEDESWGKEVTDDYAANSRVRVWFPLPGDEAVLKTNSAQSFTLGGSVATSATGHAVTGSTNVVGVALEAFSAAANQYVHVRFV